MAELGEQVLGSDAEEAIRAFQSHSDALRLTQAYGRAVAGDLDKAFKLIGQLLEAPGSALEDKFRAWLIWEMAELNRQIAASVSDRSRVETSNRVARELQALTKDGPTHLKYYAAVFELAARSTPAGQWVPRSKAPRGTREPPCREGVSFSLPYHGLWAASSFTPYMLSSP